MTHTLDVNERISDLDRPKPTHAPVSSELSRTRTSKDKIEAFVVTFGIALAILYTLFERQNWPLFTYHPAVGKLDFWMHPARSGEGPPMYWYGWLVLTAAAAFVIGWAATLVPKLRLQQATMFCCVLAGLWPIAYAVAALTVDPESFKEDVSTWTWLMGIPAAAGAAVISYLAGPRWAQRMWTSWLVLAPSYGLIILGYSLRQYFLR